MKRYLNFTRNLTTIVARWYGQRSTPHVRVIVVHTTECNETSKAAIAVGNYFRRLPSNKKASAHIIADNKTVIRCVADSKAAWAAPGCNFDGLHVELVGRAGQSKKQWDDKYSQDVLTLAARAIADWCVRYDIPLKKLTVAELKAGKKGIVGHVDVSKAYKKTNHTDPGSNFPWDDLMKKVKNELNA